MSYLLMNYVSQNVCWLVWLQTFLQGLELSNVTNQLYPTRTCTFPFYTASSPSPSPIPSPTPTSTPTSTSNSTPAFVETDTPTMDGPTTDDPNTLITAVSAGVGGVLVVCALVAVTVTAAVARAKMRKGRKTADLPDILQEPPPVSPRGGISTPMWANK